MGEVVYRSRSHIERLHGPVRRAQLPGGDGDVIFGVHGEIAEHYGLDTEEDIEPHATTLDYLVAAAGG